jgi:iron complex outermembrane receptor protein
MAAEDWNFGAFFCINNLPDKRYIGWVIVNESSGRLFEPASGRTWSAGTTRGTEAWSNAHI